MIRSYGTNQGKNGRGIIVVGGEELEDLDSLLQGNSIAAPRPRTVDAGTQGSPSLALGLVLNAAPQLVAW
jgi:hypothetical protein